MEIARCESPMETENVSTTPSHPPLKWTFSDYYDGYTLFRNKLYQPLNKPTLIVIDALLKYPECFAKTSIQITGSYSSRKICLNEGGIEVTYSYRGDRGKHSSKLHGTTFSIFRQDANVIVKMMQHLESVLKDDYEWADGCFDENDGPTSPPNTK